VKENVLVGTELRTLEVSFETSEEFGREYVSNISNGGIFVETSEALSIQEEVLVHVNLTYAQKTVEIPGEIVHVIKPSMTSAGATPGGAVHFTLEVSAVRERFEPLLGDEPPEPEPETGPANRRKTRRSRARVYARVYCPGSEVIEGRTRDLSIGGVLVSVEGGEPIAVGEPVKVTVSNPENGSEREIVGKVARHVEGEGGVVRALGVQFLIPESERSDVESFLSELSATEHTRHLGGIKGSIDEFGLVSLVETFGFADHEGTLDVMRGAEEGYLVFERGSLRAARLGVVQGVKALTRMLAWVDGHFEFHARIDRSLPESEAMPVETALIEAMRLMDASAGVDLSEFPPDARLHVDQVQRAAAGDLGKLQDSILDLASAEMNVQRVLDIVPETDQEIYLALYGLVEQQIVEVWPV
jgi:Tfp pilus assembly protein PilZ/DNA-directed RNA polymerase subunit F